MYASLSKVISYSHFLWFSMTRKERTEMPKECVCIEFLQTL